MPLLSRTRSELLQVAEYGKRDVPRIGGSEGGFIALVVGLGVIILGSCLAIYFLLRDHSPSEPEREARREERRYPSDSSRAPLKPRSPWSEKLSGIFGRGGATSKRTSKSGHGWIQASGDAWQADQADRRGGREMSGLEPVDPPFRPPIIPYTASYSSDSISYDPPETRYTPMPASTSTLSNLGSESPIPRSMSPESTVHPSSPEQIKDRNRHFSVESTNSIRTFEGGTKFIEGL